MNKRRAFLSGLVSVGLFPKATWADVGCPEYLSAARNTDGSYVLCGLQSSGAIRFVVPIPGRGHAAAAHPFRPEAVAFARRPGTFAYVIDCADGHVTHQLVAQPNRHFYGHGAFSADGSLLFTTENDIDTGRGIVGVWDTTQGYTRVSEFGSGGVGPHDIKRMPDGQTLVIANGGIETHPDTGRAKLNIPTMRPNLSYLSMDGTLLEQAELDAHLHLNSIRHLAVSQTGSVACAMQWQGDLTDHPPLLAVHAPGKQMVLSELTASQAAAMNGYAGSIAISSDDKKIAITSPRGGIVQLFDLGTLKLLQECAKADVCGVAASPSGFVLTTGNGHVFDLSENGSHTVRTHHCAWDNHLVAIQA